ncbi:hypothetical protein [Pimelobacter sp. 30-1]|uniref:hypothetical protein n=1 Tax=Pimelobacter sp. 30-1 TaxID=2004991 RepID=UPI001C03C0A5|nr:hypothetical protein [Pimelobacter sp. 30-1]MBU2696787.1 hypothetical protein [Pimelobacter sp. 30-1]
MSSRRLLWSLLRRSWRSVVVIAAAAALAAGVATATAAIRASALDALAAQVVADRGYAQGVSIQGSEEAAALLARRPDLTGLLIAPGTVTSPAGTAPAEVRALTDARPPLGALLSGRRAADATEVVVSEPLANALQVALGDQVFLTVPDGPSGQRTVVGIGVDPATSGSAFAVTMSKEIDASAVTAWLAPAFDEEIDGLEGVAGVASTQTAAADQRDRPPARVAALRYVTTGLAVLLLLGLLAVVLPHARMARTVVRSLEAAGLDTRSAWRQIRLAALVVIVGGMVAGALGGALVIHLLASSVDERLGQHWMSVNVPWSPAVVLLIVATAGCCLPARLTMALSRRPLLLAPALSGSGGWVLAAVTLLGGGVLAAISISAGRGNADVSNPVLLGLMGATLSAAGIVLLGRTVSVVRQPPATRAVVRWLADHAVLISLVCAVAAAGASTYTAFLTRDTSSLAKVNLTNQQDGSLIVSGVPEVVAETLVGDYRDRGGDDVRVVGLPERSLVPSVTTPAFAECMREGTLTTCSEGVAPADQVLASIGFDPALSASVPPRAAGAAVQDGRIGLLFFGSGDPERADVRVVAATADPELRVDDPMPSVLLSPQSEVAVEMGIRPSGIVDVELAGFGQLSIEDAAAVRGLVDRLAPTALVIEPDVDSSFLEHELSLARLIAILAAALCAALCLASGAAIAVSSAPTRRLLSEVGAGVARRFSIGFWAFLPALGASVAIAIGVPWLTAQWSGGGAAVGWHWLLPPGALFASSLAIVLALARNPTR